jgi:uncharacterized protein YceH (UPF0502 family)
VEYTLQHLAEAGFVQMLPRQAGSRESRHGHLLCGPLELTAQPEPAAPRVSGHSQRIAELERALAELRAEFEEFRRSFQ